MGSWWTCNGVSNGLGLVGGFGTNFRSSISALPEKLHHDVPNHRRYQSNRNIRSCENVRQSPQEAILPAGAGTLELAHQQIGIKEKNDEADLHQPAQAVLSHSSLP